MKRTWVLAASLVVNVTLALVVVLLRMQSPSWQLGILQRDVVATRKGSNFEIRVPRGTTVFNADPRGITAIGQFEPHRFGIVLTTEYPDLVKYDVPKEALSDFGELYSITSPEWPPSN